LISARSRRVVGVRVEGSDLIGAGARGIERERRVWVLIGAKSGVVGVGSVVVVVGAIEVGHCELQGERESAQWRWRLCSFFLIFRPFYLILG
jgi:hypothetical protein